MRATQAVNRLQHVLLLPANPSFRTNQPHSGGANLNSVNDVSVQPSLNQGEAWM
jgi:hypothetical protein